MDFASIIHACTPSAHVLWKMGGGARLESRIWEHVGPMRGHKTSKFRNNAMDTCWASNAGNDSRIWGGRPRISPRAAQIQEECQKLVIETTGRSRVCLESGATGDDRTSTLKTPATKFTRTTVLRELVVGSDTELHPRTCRRQRRRLTERLLSLQMRNRSLATARSTSNKACAS